MVRYIARRQVYTTTAGTRRDFHRLNPPSEALAQDGRHSSSYKGKTRQERKVRASKCGVLLCKPARVVEKNCLRNTSISLLDLACSLIALRNLRTGCTVVEKQAHREQVSYCSGQQDSGPTSRFPSGLLDTPASSATWTIRFRVTTLSSRSRALYKYRLLVGLSGNNTLVCM